MCNYLLDSLYFTEYMYLGGRLYFYKMIKEAVHYILYQSSYLSLYGLVTTYFLLLYFGLAPVFLGVCKFLGRKNIAHKIVDKKVSRRQIRWEIAHSFKSILIFGFSAFPIVYLVRTGFIHLLPDTFYNILSGLVILTVWNEVHFFLVHRLMHTPFFMRNVHVVHHKSTISTVYAVYSFHWFEALLLSTVPLSIAVVVPFAPITIFLYPLASILLNYAGHCNYRFGNGKGAGWKLFGTNHNEHHSRGRKNYGFASDLLDKLYSKYIQPK